MALKQFVELTDEQLLEQQGVWRKKWPGIFNEVGPVAAETPFVIMAIVPNTALTTQEIAGLVTLIEAISSGGLSVTEAVPIFHGVSPAASAVPDGHDVYFETEGRFSPRAQA